MARRHRALIATLAPLSHIQENTLFEADFSLLDNIKANVILTCQQYLAAPLVMLKLQPDGKLMPLVIQVSAWWLGEGLHLSSSATVLGETSQGALGWGSRPCLGL